MEQTLRHALSGDPVALTRLCEHFHPRLCRYFSGLLRSRQGAEDLAQETLLRMLHNLHRYRALPGARFEAWLFRIAHNLFIDQMRRPSELPLPEDYDPPDARPGAEDVFLRDERARALRGALDQLDEELKSMVLMRYDLDMDYKSIARALGVSSAKVKWRLHDALGKLKRTLESEGLQ